MAQFKLSQEQVPEELFWLYELVGMERFLKIIDTAGGESSIFPSAAPWSGACAARPSPRSSTAPTCGSSPGNTASPSGISAPFCSRRAGGNPPDAGLTAALSRWYNGPNN